MLEKSYKTLDDYICSHSSILVRRKTLYRRLEENNISEEEVSLLIEELKTRVYTSYISPIINLLSIIIALLSVILSAITLYCNADNHIEKKLLKDLGNSFFGGLVSAANVGAMSDLERFILKDLRLLFLIIIFLVIVITIGSMYKFLQKRLLSSLYAYKRFLIKKKKKYSTF